MLGMHPHSASSPHIVDWTRTVGLGHSLRLVSGNLVLRRRNADRDLRQRGGPSVSGSNDRRGRSARAIGSPHSHYLPDGAGGVGGIGGVGATLGERLVAGRAASADPRWPEKRRDTL